MISFISYIISSIELSNLSFSATSSSVLPSFSLYSITSTTTTVNDPTNHITNSLSNLTNQQQLFYTPIQSTTAPNSNLVKYKDSFRQSLPPNFAYYVNSYDINFLFSHLLLARLKYSNREAITSIHFSTNDENNLLRNKIIDNTLYNIIAFPAMKQSLKGLLCVGPGKGALYFLNKVIKRFKK